MSVSPPPTPGIETRAALKRRIIALEDENALLINRMTRTPIHSYIREGRAIRRLVSLTDPVADLIAEYDRRVMALDEGEDDIETVPSTDVQERTFSSYKKLVQWCPSVQALMKSTVQGAVLAAACQELQKGADGARGDDANTLKASVVSWLNEQDPHPLPLFVVGEKQGRGFDHDVTGKLLCPVDYNWFDPSIRDAIRDYHPRYAVTAHMWPAFLYSKGLYEATDPSNGLFKGELLVRAFQCIFTSPSSARVALELSGENAEGLPHASKVRKTMRDVRTRCNVAGLLKMRSVQPRAIAYVAVQLRFALSSRTFWSTLDDNFDYEVFYNNIVNWFEHTTGRSQAKSREVDELLVWWNRTVFGRRQSSKLHAQATEKLSVAISMR